MHKILVVDDNRDLLRLLSMRLVAGGYQVETAENGNRALAQMATFHPDLVITDLRMDGMDGMTLFKRIKDRRPTLPVMILTAHGTIPDAIEATREGAAGYLTKPFDSAVLLDEVRKTLSVSAAVDEGDAKVDSRWCESIVTRNASMLEMLSQAKMVAASDASVFIQSESGTGKELLARAIHKASPRANKPFLAINCSAVPEALLESELFGHSRGAFTGATKDHEGLFLAAEGGTLFLDEIGDMPLGFQAKLLRVLQEREVRPVGSTRSIPVDVRMISATHCNLEKFVDEKRFRSDLYYRLNVVQLELPPLRERRDDIPLLVNHHLQQLAKGPRKKHFSDEAIEVLVGAPWPGNVRQLQNVVEQATVLSHTDVIPAWLVRRALKGESSEIVPFVEARDSFEHSYLVEILQITEGNVTLAAQLARRNRTEFYRLLRRHHLVPSKFRSYSSRSRNASNANPGPQSAVYKSQ